MNSEHRPCLAIGVDIGGTDTKLAMVDEHGQIRISQRFPTQAQDSAEPFLASFLSALDDLYGQVDNNLVGIGISVHGSVDPQGNGPIMCPNTPALYGLDLRTPLEQRFHLPVIVSTDLTAHTLAEYAFGSGRGAKRFLCMAIGTGLGAGVVIDGKPLRYLGGGAGDTGHIIIQPDGPACPMGCRGCAEALCGVAGVERLAQEMTGRDWTAFEVVSQAREGDPQAAAIISQIGAWLGQALASLCAIYLPDRVALTGGISEAGPLILHACEQRFFELAGGYQQTAKQTFVDYAGARFVLGELRGQSGVVGAVVELFSNDPGGNHA